jgi:hypothetical protein
LIAVLVADVWELTKADMVTAGISKITLFNSPLSVTDPDDFLKYLRPWCARCAFSDRNLHSRMPLDPMHVRFKRICV